MLKLDRRQALGLLGAGAAAQANGAQAVPLSIVSPPIFAHGVASGDPDATSVVLWTRLSGPMRTPTEFDDHVEPESISYEVLCEVAEDSEFKRLARSIRTTAPLRRAHTVKVVADGLQPAQDYFYRFISNGVISPVGRTRTLPKGPTQDAVLAVATCALWAGGFFNVYDAIAKLDRVDAVVHLGDYIYEYGPEGFGGDIGARLGRIVDPPHEILSLADYRARHAQAKSDPKLQAAHARAPWIVVWDDHETANDAWMGGAENHNPATEGGWSERKANALRAWYEWMPIREPKPGQAFEAINRSFHFGDLASLIMVETRLAARSHQIDYAADLMVDGRPDPLGFGARLMDPARTMMGERQEAWLADELAASVRGGKRWQVLGNQVVMARVTMPDVRTRMAAEAYDAMLAGQPADIQRQVVQAGGVAALGLPFNLDGWDGYPLARERLYAALTAAKASPIVLSGDSHAFWANELHDAAGNRVAAEFGATGVTSPGVGDVLAGAPLNEALVERNKEVRYTNQAAKGFVLLTLTREAATADMVAVSTVFAPQYETRTLKRFAVAPAESGVGALAEVS